MTPSSPSLLLPRRSAWGVNAVAGIVVLRFCAPAAATSVVKAEGRPKPTEGTYVLQPAADGGYTYNAKTFEARIARDGHVTFKDVHGSAGLTVLGMPLFGAPEPPGGRPSLSLAISDWLRPNPKRPIPFSLPESPGFADPTLALPAEMRRPLGPMLVGVTGTFDLTDELMLQTGQGWYRTDKAKFLSATFEFRLKMAVTEHRRLLLAAIDELPDRLRALWADGRYTPRERRRIVFLLWAEVDVRDDSGRAIVRAIESWIRNELPEGSASAYTPDELKEFQRTAEGRVFSPYGSPAGLDPSTL